MQEDNPDYSARAEGGGRSQSEEAGGWQDCLLELPQPIFTLSPSHIVTGANPAALDALGKPKEEVLGRPCHELFHGSSAPVSGCPAGKLLRGEGSGAAAINIETLGGTFLVSCTPFFDGQGKITKILHMATDITELRVAEKAREESEEKYRIHFENIFDVIYSLDRDLKILHVSPSVERELGYTQAELTGKVFTDLPILAHESMDLAFSNIKRILAGERVPGAEYVFVAKDGTRKVGEVNGSPLRSKNGDIMGIISVGRDITRRKQIEEELRFAQFIVDGAGESIHGLLSDGRFAYVNESMCKNLGYTREELLSMTIGDVDPTHTPDVYRRTWEEVKTKGSISLETVHRRKDGTFFPVEILSRYMRHGDREYAIAFGRDMTEQKRAEQKIIESERSLLGILSSSPIGIGRIKNRTFAWINETVCRMTGYAESEVTGMDARFLYESDEEYHRVGKELYSPEGRVETRIVRKDGTIRDMLMQISASDSDSYIFTVTDITEQRQRDNAFRFTQFAIDKARDIVMWEGEGGEILYVNDAACVATGYTREELLSMTISVIDPTITAEKWKELWEKRKLLGAFSYESQMRTRDGRAFPVEISSSYVEYNDRGYACAIVRDIRERKQNEEALQESEGKYRTVVENSLVGFYIIQDGLFRFVNKRFCEIFGYSYGEIVDKLDPVMVAHPDDRERVRTTLQKRISGERRSSNTASGR